MKRVESVPNLALARREGMIMDIATTARRVETWLVVLCSIATLAHAPVASAAGPGESNKIDCGANALFVMARLEGRPVTLDRLISALPPRHHQGYSMAEMVVAAQSLGLGLEGVRLGRFDRPLDRPAIAFIKDARGGHYAVLRPVGATGTMVQVIDPPLPPLISDYEQVFSTKTWTSQILIRRDSWIARNSTLVLTALGGCVLLVASFTRRLRTATKGSFSDF